MTESQTEPQIVWEAGVDQGTYRVIVIRSGEYRGTLRVTRIEDDKVLLDEEVGLSYDALFGPDQDDILSWQDKAIVVIDADKETA